MKSKGEKTYIKAKRLIPGGSQLLSKRPEMFLPENWPNYYSRANGFHVWDLDNNRFSDMSIMGIGTCSLGYANPAVNRAVIQAVSNGSMCTLNSIEEVLLAEKLIALHPGMEMVRFSRTGGEANAIAIRIARAASAKQRVAVCGYHGWHDWYLSVNHTNSDGLDRLLLPGLHPNGVPEELKETTLPFEYGNIAQLRNIVTKFGSTLGCICIEVQRSHAPNIEFLTEVRKLATDINAVLIFDEISSGFRLSVGGAYKLYGITPDIVVLGKALGNGYAISAILGKRSVMEAAQDSFISSSYWSERTGFAAALETINVFEKENIVQRLMNLGTLFRATVEASFADGGLHVTLDGIHTVPLLTIHENDPLLVKTVLTQEMLSRGFLASTVVYLSSAHTKDIILHYSDNIREVSGLIKRAIHEGTLKSLLKGPVCHSTFGRLA